MPLPTKLGIIALARSLEPVNQVERDALGTSKCSLLRESAKGRIFHNWRLRQWKENAMKVHRNCCGLDVHKQTIAACLIHEDGMGHL